MYSNGTTAGMIKQFYADPVMQNISVPANGYVYVYCSNESPSVTVYFDNLQVAVNHGPLVEEDHYYPQGLAMTGIDARALNFGGPANYYKYQGQEMQDNEFSYGNGLQEYDFNARFYDQQLGVWHSQDPARQYASPYLAMGNNWPHGIDPSGKLFLVDDIVVAAVGFTVGFTESILAGHANFGQDVVAGLEGAGIAELGYLTLGGGALGPGAAAAGDASGTAVASLAVPYATSYAATSAFTFAQNADQIENTPASSRFGLLAGYDATSAISAGFNSNFQQNQIDKVLNIPTSNNLFSGAVSQGIGGAISNAGNNILANGGGWTKNTGFSAISGFASSFAGQVAHNEVGSLLNTKAYNADPKNYKYPFYSIPDIIKNAFSNIASGVTQQIIGNWASQIGSKNGYNDVGNPNAGQYIEGTYWWGSYINGLGGFTSDMYNDAH